VACSVLRWREFEKGVFKENLWWCPQNTRTKHVRLNFNKCFLNKILSRLTEKHNYPTYVLYRDDGGRAFCLNVHLVPCGSLLQYKLREQIPPKFRYLSSRLHAAMSQRRVILKLCKTGDFLWGDCPDSGPVGCPHFSQHSTYPHNITYYSSFSHLSL
jgi:hypothetical protein